MRDLTPPRLKINPANTFTVLKSRVDELRPRLEKFLRVWAMATRAAKLDPERVSGLCRTAVPGGVDELGRWPGPDGCGDRPQLSCHRSVRRS